MNALAVSPAGDGSGVTPTGGELVAEDDAGACLFRLLEKVANA